MGQPLVTEVSTPGWWNGKIVDPVTSRLSRVSSHLDVEGGQLISGAEFAPTS